MISAAHYILHGWWNNGEWDARSIQHGMERTEMRTGFWWGDL